MTIVSVLIFVLVAAALSHCRQLCARFWCCICGGTFAAVPTVAGFTIGKVPDSVETVLNSSADELFTAAVNPTRKYG